MACTATYPVAALQDRSASICSKGKKQNNCSFKTCLIGPVMEGEKNGVDTSTTTHFAITLVPLPKEEEKHGSESAALPKKIAATARNNDVATYSQVIG